MKAITEPSQYFDSFFVTNLSVTGEILASLKLFGNKQTKTNKSKATSKLQSKVTKMKNQLDLCTLHLQ